MDRINQQFKLPLPKRIWQYWDQPCKRLGFFRKFDLDASVEVMFCLSASGETRVWFDQKEVVLQESNMPSWYSMMQISLQLQKGEHEILIVVENSDESMPFMMCSLDWDEAGTANRLVSDKTWLIQKELDPDKLFPGSDVDLDRAWECGSVWTEPWGMPCNVPDDYLRLATGWQEIQAETLMKSISTYSGFEAGGGRLSILDDGSIIGTSVKPSPYGPEKYGSARPAPMWHLIRENQCMQINNWLNMFEFRSPHAIYDLGGETFGRIKITLRHGGPAIIAIATGESLQELNHYSRRISDVFILKNGETFATSPSGFRYIKLMVIGNTESEVVLDPLTVQHVRYPVVERGSFTCSDTNLDKIWNLSLETLYLCMQNEIWDGIRRDQLPWMGDLYVEALAAYIFFNDAGLTGHTLAMLADLGPAPSRPFDLQRNPGLQAVWRSPNGDINGIPSYTLWWMIGLSDYFMHTGDVSLIHELKEDLVHTLNHFIQHVDETGLWNPMGKFNFIDWAPVPEWERQLFCHLLACHALGLGLSLLDVTGDKDEKAVVETTRARMVRRAREIMKLPEQESGDADVTGQVKVSSLGISHHVNAMAIRSGVLDITESQSLFENSLEEDTPFLMTYWHRYADLDASAIVGNVKWGLDYIRRHWGKFLEMRTNTLWEAFDASWLNHSDPHSISIVGDNYAAYGGYRTSLCHGWSAGAAIWLSKVILGVEPVLPGYKKVHFKPELGDLEWAQGSIPTPLGLIRISLGQDNGKRKAMLEIPQSIEVEIDSEIDRHWEVEIKRG